MVSTLLQKGAEKKAHDKLGESPLVKASKNGHLAVVKTLLAAGADANVRARRGLRVDGIEAGSALDWAPRNGHVVILRALLGHGADMNSMVEPGVTVLHHAASGDQADSVHELIEAGADREKSNACGWTPLMFAGVTGSLEAMVALLQRGAAVNYKLGSSSTLLHEACKFFLLPKTGRAATLDLLLRWGADETALDDQGRTPENVLDTCGILVREGRTAFLEDQLKCARLLLVRAPADRAWRRRCWLLMLRSRSSAARNGGPDGGGIGGNGLSEGSNRERSCKVGKGFLAWRYRVTSCASKSATV